MRCFSKPDPHTILLLVDHDGCLGDQFAHPDETTKSTLHRIIRLVPLMPKDIQHFILACASLRQSFSYDILGMMMNAWQTHSSTEIQTHFNGSIKHSLEAIQQAISELYPSIPITPETFLLPDLAEFTSELQLPHLLQEPSPWHKTPQDLEEWLKHQTNQNGEEFTSWLKREPPYQQYLTRQRHIETTWGHLLSHTDEYTDTSKFTTLLLQVHFSALNQSSSKIYGLYVDDKPEYAHFFHKLVMLFPTLIPRKCIFFPVLYTYHSITKASSTPTVMRQYCIEGHGQAQPNITSLCRDWLRQLKHLRASTRDVVTTNLSSFTQHFAPLINSESTTHIPQSQLPQKLFSSNTQTTSHSEQGASNKTIQLPTIPIATHPISSASVPHSPRVTQRKQPSPLLDSLPASDAHSKMPHI